MPDADPLLKLDVLRSHGALNPNPEAVTDELFSSHQFFDPRDLVQVKYEMLRRVQLDNRPVAETSASFGFSRPSFYRIQEVYENQGLSGLLPRRRGPQGRHKVTAEVLEFLVQARREEPGLRPAQLVELAKDRFGLELHPRTVERALASKKNS